jgi:patatin-like phospholipase/acyl hydrolase
VSVLERAKRAGPKRLLALDGGGIRGIICIEILAELERRLAEALNRGEDFRLAEYFDYVAGTSTGAIIATCIAKGFRVDEIRDFYLAGARSLLTPAPLWRRLNYRYMSADFTAKLKLELGEETLGDESLRTLLLLVLRNADTDSPWPLSNNPFAKYNDRTRPDSNLTFPLWQLVRGSTAAPTYFPPEEIVIGGKIRKFVDGAVSVYNNPAFLLFVMATAAEYRLQWAVGEEHLLLVSIGTGSLVSATDSMKASQMTVLYNARHVPSALLNAASAQQDTLCRLFGRCHFGEMIDREIGSLTLADAGGDSFMPKKFTYARYTPDISQDGLKALGLANIKATDVQPLLASGHTAELQLIGRTYAQRVFELEHFGTHAPLTATP